MSWFLRVQDGGQFRDVAVLNEEQSLIVGRAETADLAFPDDGEMSSRHVSLTLRGGQCEFSDLHSTNGTYLDGEPAFEGMLLPGSTLQCGMTVFCVDSGQTSAPGKVSAIVEAKSGVTRTAKSTRPAQKTAPVQLPEEMMMTAGFVSELAADVDARFSLKESLGLVPDAGETSLEFATRLLSSDGDNDSLCFLAFALPKRLGVWWALECLRSVDGLEGKSDKEPMAAVQAWVASPSDATRRAAMKQAESSGMETAAAWAGVAAFWSHGSMAPEGQPDIPAKDDMAGKALAGSVILASVSVSPENAPQRRKAFVEIARKIAAGKHPLPPNAD